MSRRTIIIAGIISLFVILFLLRGTILRLYVSNKVNTIEERYSLVINYDKLTMSGLYGVRIEKLSVNPKGGDTLFYADHIMAQMNPFKLLFLSTDLRQLEANCINISFVKRDSLSNFDFLYKDTKTKKDNSDSLDSSAYKKINYSKSADRMLSLLLRVLPSNAKVTSLNIQYINGPYNLRIAVPELTVQKDVFSAKITTTENGISENLLAEGTLCDSKRMITAKIFNNNSVKFSVPFLTYRWGAKVQFDKLEFELSGTDLARDTISLSGKAIASGVSVFHERISPENVILDKGEFCYKLNIGKNYFEMDSSSVATVNNFSFSPYLKITKMNKWSIIAALNKSEFPSDQLFSSLPKGLFYNLEGIKTSGSLNYHFYLNLDLSKIDSLKVESLLKPNNFRIVNYGNTDLRKMNSDFEYTAYENGEAVRSFIVGPSNPNFRTLDRISPNLQMAVLQSEDGGFFYHNGFLIESIREALVTDIKERKFRRGGSTISMQLVKNVFLNRHKTLARKFEEILIVWMIESNRLSSKERMFETYMNIIEWGPKIYGANEAARFYFDKDVKDINVNEAIFLASIIPSPKRALSSFNDNLQLKPYLEGYYKLLAQRFRVKGLITEQEELLIRPEVKLAGEAKKILQDSKQIIQ